MTGALPVALLGWALSAGLALALARRRAAAIARGAHLARVAHELRGPLHAAGLVLCTAQRHAAGSPCTAALTALEVELGRAALAVTDLVDGTAPTRRRPTPSATCDVAALVRESAAGWTAMAGAHGRSLVVDVPRGPVRVGGERLRLAQALGNLVANALEHGGGAVQIAVRPASGGTAQVEVCDAGDGLPATVAALVASPADPQRRRGHGLGIACRIAQDAGGRLSAAPAAQGARLVLNLPAPGDAAAAGPAPEALADRPTRPVAS